jgi:thioredoxin-like negative regulator of GroEL
MRRALFPFLLILIAVAIVIAASVQRRPHEVIPWRTDFQAAMSESQRTGKPMLVDFTATWCGPCQDMRRTTWSDPNVARALSDYIPVQVDLDAHPELAARYGVNEIPCIALCDGVGKPVAGHLGELSIDQLLSWLKQARSRPGKPLDSP